MKDGRAVLVLVQEYPDEQSLKGIWAEQQTRALATCHTCRVVMPLEVTVPKLAPILTERHGIPVTRIPFRQVRKSWWLPFLGAALRGVLRERKQFRPELLHAHMGTRAGWAAVVAGKLLRIPVVVTEHWGTIAERLASDRRASWALRYAIRNADEWIAVSRSLASEIDALRLRPPVPVIGNVLDPVFIRPYQAAPPAPPFRLVYSGRIDNRAKGLDVLLEALARLRKQEALPFRLEVLGDGPARADFEALARKLEVQEQIAFRGWLPPSEVADRLRAAHALVIPSDYETYGMAYLEALACGRPVLGCAVGALPELIPNWAGVLVPPRSPENLADAIRNLGCRMESWDGPRMIDYARATCSPEVFREQVTAVYDRVVRARKAAR